MIAPRVFVALALALLITGCASLPGHVERTPSTAITQTADTRLGKDVLPLVAAHPGKSGIHPLSNAEDAFAARIVLARLAERSLDLQYYIWHADTTGQLLWEAVWQAAERGVRVRLLLDDANTGGLDPTLAALDAHPNIEVRLFNPFANRGFRVGDFALDFSRVNRRMHNKSYTADNMATIVGGRNVGDEYYGANMEVGFQDLDVLAIGPVVSEVSNQFDLFWNSASAYPASSLMAPAPAGSAATLRAGWDKVRQNPEAIRYAESVRQTPLMRELAEHQLSFGWTAAHVIHDDPEKVLQPTTRTDLQMAPALRELFGNPKREIDLVSPYFVPGKEGTKVLSTMAENGVKVRILTNSLSATDVSPVHAGYSKYRKELLKSGAVLYELKPGAAVPPPDKSGKNAAGGSGDRERGFPGSGGSGSGGSSASSLHAKTFAVDRERIFVGSFNLDPRSSRLNTEMGVVIDSPEFAGMLTNQFETVIPSKAYEVRLQPDGEKIEWIDNDPEGKATLTTEPGSDALQRLWIDFLEILPIEWLL